MKNITLIDKLVKEARLGKLSRRTFMNYSLAAGITTSTSTLLSPVIPETLFTISAFVISPPKKQIHINSINLYHPMLIYKKVI